MSAAAVAATSAGNGFVVAALLGVAAGPVLGVGAGLAMAATVARWGTADLGVLAGDQAVLGPAVLAGEVTAVASTALAAFALLLAAATVEPDDRPLRWSLVIAGGAAAAAVACGPAATSAADLALRVGASLAGGAATLALTTPPARALLPTWTPVAAGLAAVMVGVL